MIARRNEGWTVGMIAAAHDVSDATVHKWIRRHREEGKTGLVDRTSRPRTFRRPVPQARIHQIISLRQRRLTGWQIARTLRMPRSTVATVLQRVGLARLSLLEDGSSPAEVAVRVGYQSAAHFSRDFKSQFTLPPAAYVRRFRDGGGADRGEDRRGGGSARSQDPARRSQSPASSPPPA